MKEDIHIRLDENLIQPVREYAKTHGISLAAAISLIIKEWSQHQTGDNS